MRLQVVLAKAGITSRRRAEKLIRAGLVKVNGQTITEQGLKVNPCEDEINVNGELIKCLSQDPVYLILNKPVGYITTNYDPGHRPTIRQLLGGVKERVFSVGRLDRDSGGLLLLTNDGELAYRLTHPKYKVEKNYQVEVSGHVSSEALGQLREGVQLEDFRTAPAKVEVFQTNSQAGTSVLGVKIFEGKKRQIRLMCRAVGLKVISLTRLAIGPIVLGDLPSGKYRYLTEEEIEELRKILSV